MSERHRPAGGAAMRTREPQASGVVVRRVMLDPGNVWRIGLVVLGLIALTLVIRFILGEGSSLIFTAFMAWFVSLAMEPAVSRLARHMPRGVATGLVLLGVVAFLGIFFGLFGQLIVEQVANLVQSVPDLVEQLLNWVNSRFGTDYAVEDLLATVDLSSERAASVAGQVAGGVLAGLRAG